MAATTRTSTLLRARFAHREHFALLEEAQQFWLNVERQVADLVEEQRAADGRPQDARLIGYRAREAAAAMAEQLAVGELARGAGAVVGQEHPAAAEGAGVDRAGDEVLARAALAGDQDGQVVVLQVLDLIGYALHGCADANEPGKQRLELPLHDGRGDLHRALARLTKIETLAQNGRKHPEPLR